MSYTDDLRPLQYTSPSGKTFTLDFDELSRTGGKKGGLTEFPGLDQGAVQDLGNNTPTFPISCYIAGQNYHTEADRFYNALHEPGVGTLIHPRWGTMSVMPQLQSQGEQFVEGAGRAVFSITFIRADLIVLDYPRATDLPDERISANADATETAIIDSIPDETLTNAKKKTGLKAGVLNTISNITRPINNLTAISSDIATNVNQTINEITVGIDELVLSPALLAQSLLTLYRLPARVATNVEEKIKGYRTIYNNIYNGFLQTSREYGDTQTQINIAQLQAIAISAAESTLTGFIYTRLQAINTLEELIELYKLIQLLIESLETAGNFTADYDTLRLTELTVKAAIQNLIERSLSLPVERSMILEREVNPITLCFEIYGDSWPQYFDTFMDYNNFQGNSILLVPRGTVVRWYV